MKKKWKDLQVTRGEEPPIRRRNITQKIERETRWTAYGFRKLLLRRGKGSWTWRKEVLYKEENRTPMPNIPLPLSLFFFHFLVCNSEFWSFTVVSPPKCWNLVNGSHKKKLNTKSYPKKFSLLSQKFTMGIMVDPLYAFGKLTYLFISLMIQARS